MSVVKMKKGIIILIVMVISMAAGLTSANALGEIEILVSADSGEAPLTVSFRSNETAESYAWDFDGDSNIDSAEAEPEFTYALPGIYTAILNATLDGNSGNSLLAQKIITVDAVSATDSAAETPLSLSLAANPSSGQAPLTVQFTLAAAGKAPLTYAWYFNNDSIADSTLQNPSYAFTQPGEYSIVVKVTDAEGNSAEETYALSVSRYDSHLNLTAYFPQTLAMGENQVTLLVNNDGTEPVRDISAKFIGVGVQHLTSGSIPLLKAGEQDSLTVKIRILQSSDNRELSATAKIADKNFPLTFNLVEEIKYNKEELQNRLSLLKEQFKQQEDIYMDKKARGYLVSEIFENIKSIQKQIQDTQQFVLSGKYAEASINLDMMTAAIADLTVDLEQSRKQKVTPMMWLKDNALAITAIVAALGTVGGILVKVLLKVKSQAVKVKEQAQRLTEDMKKKFPMKKNGSNGSEKKEESYEEKEKPREGTKEETKTDKKPEEETMKNL